jgi:hypothetical protein
MGSVSDSIAYGIEGDEKDVIVVILIAIGDRCSLQYKTIGMFAHKTPPNAMPVLRILETPLMPKV